jgi:alcohol dehydrogenase class IV
MPYVLKANKKEIEVRINRLTNFMGLSENGFDGFLNWVLDMREQIGIPHTLKEIGIDTEKSETVGKMAIEDPSAGGNPIQFTADQYQQIFLNAVNGEL